MDPPSTANHPIILLIIVIIIIRINLRSWRVLGGRGRGGGGMVRQQMIRLYLLL